MKTIIFLSKKNKPAEWGRFKFKFENAYIQYKVKLKPDGETRSFNLSLGKHVYIHG